MRCVGRRSKGDTWRWNEEVKEEVSRKKDAHKVTCKNSTAENKRRYKSMKNKVKKALNKMKTGKVVGLSDVLLELIAAVGGVEVMSEICQSPC